MSACETDETDQMIGTLRLIEEFAGDSSDFDQAAVDYYQHWDYEDFRQVIDKLEGQPGLP